MQYDITYSLRMALETYLPEITKAEIMRDGIDLNTLTKPYATVEYIQTLAELMSAGRTSYRDDLAYSIGIFARDINELNRLETKARNTVIRRADGIPFFMYDYTEEKFVRTEHRLVLEETSFTPMGADDSTKESEYYKGYFVISVDVLRTMGEEGFTQ